MDRFSKKIRSMIMSRIRSKNTGPERIMADILDELRVKPQRWVNMPGKPDFVFEKAGIAVFVDGCFWHRCPRHSSKPKTNRKFWSDKFSSNVARDRRVTKELERSGWLVVRFWECVVRKDPDHVLCLMQIKISERINELNDPRRQDSV
jgi:DNA mismatch endonuclease (patch repair protein)